MICKYIFEYETIPCTYVDNEYGGIYYSGKFTLSSITQKDCEDDEVLPPLTFNYEDRRIYRDDSVELEYNGNPGNPAVIYWPYLTDIGSGYSGGEDTVVFTYQENPCEDPESIWTREVVVRKTIDPGIGDIQTYAYSYSGNPQYLGTGWNQEYRGFTAVGETDSEQNSVWHYFYTTGGYGSEAEKLTGKEYLAQWFDNEENRLREVENTWECPITEEIEEGDDAAQFGGAYLSGQRGITVGPDGNVYAISTSNSYIVKFNPDGTLIDSGSLAVFNGPRDIAVANDGYIYVTSYSDNRVYKVKPDLTLEESYDHNTYNFLLRPSGIAVADDGTLYIACYYSYQNYYYLVVRSPDENWGVIGYGSKYFNNPQSISLAPDGSIYVASYGDNRIVKFNPDGSYDAGGSFNHTGPTGVDITADGSIYVASYSTGADYIVKYPPEGDSTTFLSGYSSGNKDIAIGEYLIYTSTDSGAYDCLTKMARAYQNWNIRLTQVEDTVTDLSETAGDRVTRVEYDYDEHGNVITEYHQGDTDPQAPADEYTVWRTYSPNTEDNILNKPSRERVYIGIVAEDDGDEETLQKETCYYYDGTYHPDTSVFDGDDVQTPEKGNLTRVDRKTDASSTITTRYGYDSYGNKIAEKDPNNNLT